MRLPDTSLSREGRDTLWLLCVLTLSILPHMTRLPLWCAAGAAGAIVWRAQIAWKDGALPPRWVLITSLIVSVALTLWTFNSLFGREAGITLVTLLAGLKTLELRARRDAFVITSLGFFLILTQFLYSQSLPIAALMLVVLMGWLTALVLAQRPTGRPSIWSAAKVAGRSVLMGLPVMLALYVLFPRLGPLWSVPSDAGQHTGLSDKITLGNVANLAQDDSVAMRIRFWGAVPKARDMYFRGPVLDVFDGSTWQTRASLPGLMSIDDSTPLRASGSALKYQLTLEPNKIAAIPLLEGTLAASPTPPATEPQIRRDGLNWVANHPLTERSQLDAQAWQGVKHGPTQANGTLNLWLQLPMGFTPRTRQWAHDFRLQPYLQNADESTLSNAVLQHIRQSSYRYTLSPGGGDKDDKDKPQRDAIDHFWVDSKAGFCEHFATAYVVIMRAMGVPARVVTGFQGAELNPVDGLYVVRNSDAHAWAEYWQAGEGWTRVDPTAAVAPERIDHPRQIFRNLDASKNVASQINATLWGPLRAYMNAGDHRWNVWVLQYSRNKQMALLKDWGVASPDWVDLIRLCGGVLVGVSMMGLVWLWWTRPRSPKTPWHKPLMSVHKALASAGIPAPDSSPAPAAALSWISAINRTKRTLAQDAIQARLIASLQQLDALRYAPQSSNPRQIKRDRIQIVSSISQLAKQWRTTLS
ncbi:MAG: transglutaminaseTgpA domain-containing protein [Polaromonas sp.]|nr:transglutaminaseTgpA domain-containing protein [Polaromonas sp.]